MLKARRRMNRSQLNGFIAALGAGENKLGREHWTDVFHESDGESASGTGLGKAKDDKVGVKD